MWIATTDGKERVFLFESSVEEHFQFMKKVATGYRGQAYAVGSDPVEVPDIVGGYAIANVEAVEECSPPAPPVLEDGTQPPKKRRRTFTRNK